MASLGPGNMSTAALCSPGLRHVALRTPSLEVALSSLQQSILVLFVTPVLRISRLHQSFFTCKKPLYYHGYYAGGWGSQTLCATFDLCMHPIFLLLAPPQHWRLFLLSSACHISPNLPYFPNSGPFPSFPKATSCYPGKQKLADSQHQSAQPSARVPQSWHGAGDGWTAREEVDGQPSASHSLSAPLVGYLQLLRLSKYFTQT